MPAIEPDDSWFNRPVLDDGETVVKSYPANHTQGKRAVGGKLFLTTRRLVFVPNRLDSRMGGQIWEASRCIIRRVGRVGPHFSIVELFSGALRSRLIYRPVISGGSFASLQPGERLIAACWFTRHHDGHIRERFLRALPAFDSP